MIIRFVLTYDNLCPETIKIIQILVNLHETVFVIGFVQLLSYDGTQLYKKWMFPWSRCGTRAFSAGVLTRNGFGFFIH